MSEIPEHWKGLKMLQEMRLLGLTLGFKSTGTGLRSKFYVMNPDDAREYAGLMYDTGRYHNAFGPLRSGREVWVEFVCTAPGYLNFKGLPVIQSDELNPGEFCCAVDLKAPPRPEPLSVPLPPVGCPEPYKPCPDGCKCESPLVPGKED